MIGLFRQVVPKFVRRRYALKFGIALLILAVAVGVLGLTATAAIENEVRTNVNDNLQDVAGQQAATVESWNSQNKEVTNLTASSDVVQDGSRNEVFSLFNGRIENLGGGAEALYLVDTTNNQVMVSSRSASDPNESTPLSESEIAWAEEGLADGPRFYVSDPYQGSDDKRLVAYAALLPEGRTAEGDAALGAYVVYVVDVSSFENGQLAAGTTTEGANSMVVINSSQIVMNTGQADFMSQYPHANDFGSDDVATISEPEGALRESIASDNEEFTSESYVIVRSEVDNAPGWVLFLHIPQTQAYGFVTDVSRAGLLATIGGVLLIGIVGAVLGRNTATAIDRLTTKTEQMEEGNLNVDFETQRIDNVGRLYGGFAEMRDALRERIQEARDAREEAEMAREEAEQMTEHLETKADQYRDSMQLAADGDLRQRLDPESESPAMTEIAQEFNEMLAEIEQTMGQLKNFANEVATSSEEVTASSEEVRSASEQVTESIQEISDGAEQQNDSLQSVSQEMDSLSTTTEEIAASSNEVADLAERTAETGRTGQERAQKAIENMTELDEQSQVVTEQMNQLADEVNQIDELIDFISEIAEQTNMLALNANIEASRSTSGSGEGFAVVAQEVKDLAEETKDAASDIEERLERIQDQTGDTVSGVEQANEQIAAATQSVEGAVDALEEIAGYAQETNTGVQEISAATEEQAASTQEVVAMVDEATTISEETTAESENVAAAAEEQTTALTEVSQSASELAQQASQLSEALDRFDTDADAGSFDLGVEQAEMFPEDESEAPADGESASEALDELTGGETLDDEFEDDLGAPADEVEVDGSEGDDPLDADPAQTDDEWAPSDEPAGDPDDERAAGAAADAADAADATDVPEPEPTGADTDAGEDFDLGGDPADDLNLDGDVESDELSLDDEEDDDEQEMFTFDDDE